MSKERVIVFMLGLASGGAAMLVGAPHLATAEGAGAAPGLYQIRPATGLAQPGSWAVWRLNTASGALEFCTFENVSAAGANRINCSGNPAMPAAR